MGRALLHGPRTVANSRSLPDTEQARARLGIVTKLGQIGPAGCVMLPSDDGICAYVRNGTKLTPA